MIQAKTDLQLLCHLLAQLLCGCQHLGREIWQLLHHSNQVRLSGRGVRQSMLSSCTVECLVSILLPPAH